MDQFICSMENKNMKSNVKTNVDKNGEVYGNGMIVGNGPYESGSYEGNEMTEDVMVED